MWIQLRILDYFINNTVLYYVNYFMILYDTLCYVLRVVGIFFISIVYFKSF